MGILDVTKMAAKAMQARKKMSKIQAVGQSGTSAVVINGVYSVVDLEVDLELLKGKLNMNNSSESVLKDAVNIIKKDIMAAFEDSKKQLEKEMANSTNLEDLKGLLQS